MKRILAYISVMIALAACTREEDHGVSPDHDSSEDIAVFGYHVRSLDSPGTKSAFIAPAFDDSRVTGITVAVYDDDTGSLHYKKHFTSGFDAMEIPLRGDRVYHLYALANMGDQTGRLPSSRSSLLSDFTYTVPSYSDVNARGIPMTGSIENYTAAGAEEVFDLRRLFAKVTLNVTTSYDGGTQAGVKVTNIKVGNANGILSAFGSSRLTSASNRMAQEDYTPNSSVNASSVVFYVPENLQGKIGSAATSHDKNPDRDNAVRAVKDLLTYIDVTVTANSVYYVGTIHYRSYIGADARTDFNVAGNYRYVWNMTLTEDGLVYDDWKTDQTDFNVIDHYISFDADVYPVSPRKSVVSTVEYTDSYRGRVTGQGGVDGQGVRWTVIPPASLPHSASGTSYLDFAYDAGTDAVTWTPTRYAPPGYYAITVTTTDGRYYDDAVLHVNDTRWINTDAAYDGRPRETTINRANVNATTKWNIGYAYGDQSVSDSGVRDVTSPNAGHYAGVSMADEWSRHIGFSLQGDASQYLTVSGTPGSNAVSYSLSQDILMGDYKYMVYWKDTWDEDRQDYALKDSAILHVTGTYMSSMYLTAAKWTLDVGETIEVRAIPRGNPSFPKVEWEILTGDDKVSLVSTANLNAALTGLREGTASIRARALDGSGVVSETRSVTVSNPPVSLTIIPSQSTVYMGTTLAYTAIVTYSDGSTADVTSSCNWSTESSTIARFDSTLPRGVVMAQNTAGTVAVTARYSIVGKTVSGTASLSVVARPSPISIEYLDGPRYIFRNATYGSGSYTVTDINDLRLKLNYQDGSSITGTFKGLNVSLSSNNPDIVLALAGNNKTLQAYDKGSATITVTCDGLQTSFMVYASKVRLAPWRVDMGVYGSQKAEFFLTGYDETVEHAAEVLWYTADSGIAGVSAAYGASTYILPNYAGSTRLSADYTGLYGHVVIEIPVYINGSNDVSHELKVMPDPCALNSGSSQQLTAKYHTISGGVDDGGVDVTSAVTWSIFSGDSFVTINDTGLVTGRAQGTAKVKARYSGQTDYVTVVVTDVPVVREYYLEITPASSTVIVGGTRQLTALFHTKTNGTDDGGVPVDASWTVSAGSGCASVSGSGLVSGMAVGTATVVAGYAFEGETYPATATVSVVRQMTESYRLGLTPSETTIAEGATLTYEVRKYTDIYTDGVLSYRDPEGVVISNSSVNWSVTGGGSCVTVNAAGVATGVASGDATIKAALKSNTSLTATALLHVDVVFNVDPGEGGSGNGSGNY